MTSDDFDLSACRDEVFNRLYEIWNETEKESDRLWQASQRREEDKTEWQKDNWRKANTLQAVAQYWSTSSGGQADKAMDLLIRGYNFYTKVKSGPKIWVDDFGWWAVFFTDLDRYTGWASNRDELKPPFDHGNLWAETTYCYERMQANLDKIHGGIWNDPAEKSTFREKNTITN